MENEVQAEAFKLTASDWAGLIWAQCAWAYGIICVIILTGWVWYFLKYRDSTKKFYDSKYLLIKIMRAEEGDKRREVLLDICVEYSTHLGTFCSWMEGIGDRPEVHAHFLRSEAKKLIEQARDLEARMLEETEKSQGEDLEA
ncbi:hypothetical protein BDZ45DRAFT_802474 [Acephala macrosclerotiorum]|nr:hypothetical protein BDZ45DRAFT_802474 [Acephala macrosclerotiorum]